MNNDDNTEEMREIPFSTPLEAYQAYIDSLPEWLNTSIQARRVRKWDNKPLSSNYEPSEAFHTLMRRFDSEQRQYIASMLEAERRACVFDCFNFLNDQTGAGGLRLSFHGVELPIEPYGEKLYIDWAWRLSGQVWPEEDQDWQDAADFSEEEL